ncbi:amidase [Rhodoplanes sp. TEM]|uniref:Amidase n=1 Tax=Rhodoplanes tepidamans TaxID=200616 RepID=A0ABT5JI78_RHOTP|nr:MULTISPECIES: amidase [Rhodoplanes]MDC7789004.1 amidase [Rhodoplanes tepidamans]MDC7986396.1 amidase [Rhodoplanes sp. TEM]MDQ0355717.1 amidase [Rhodoplanes tepidamans]
MPTETFRSAFVPHDLAAPVAGAPAGPLAGLSVAVKDMYDIAGERTGGGNPDWLEAHPPATAHADLVAKLLAAGATITGKTVCDEFFFSVAGVNAHYGTPLNPRAPGRIPGGSSSGSASAASAGACDVAIGSDTGGSVRVPAAFCGLYGIRPTHDRVSLAGAMAMAPSFDVAGWMSAAPGVFRALGAVLLGGTPVPAAIEKLIVLDDAFSQADDDVATLLQDALDTMRGALPAMTHGAIAPDGFDVWREAFRIIQGREIWQVYGDFVETKRPRFGPGVRERMEFASTVTEAAAAAQYAVKAKALAWIRGVAKPGTVLALPTVPCIAPRADAPQDLLESFRVRVMRLTCTAGMAGLPQVTIPVGTIEGCPVGLSFIGWAGGDEVLLDLAVRLAPFVGAAATE